MWAEFFFGYIVLTAFVFIPGFLFAKALGRKTLESISYAPFITIALYEILSIIYEKLGVFSEWQLYFLPILSVGVLCLLIRCLIDRRKFKLGDKLKDAKPRSDMDWKIYLFYVFFGLFFIGLIIVRNLDGADSFAQSFDSYSHLGVPCVFLESGNWSSLHVTLFGSSDGFEAPVQPGFYPAAWDLLVAAIMQACSLPVTVAVNVVNVFFPSFVLSTGMVCLLQKLFKNNRAVLIFGALATYAIAAFPYISFCSGLFPNIACVCLVPSVAASFIQYINTAIELKRPIINMLVIVLIGSLAVAFCHPSLIFTLIVILTPFCIQKITSQTNIKTSGRVALSCIFLTVVCLFWIAMYKAPFMQSVLYFKTPAVGTPPQTLIDVATLSFTDGSAQILVGLLVLLGIIQILRKRNSIWLVGSYILFVVLYVISSIFDGSNLIKHILTGFWYSSSLRVSWGVCLCAIPFLAVGLAQIYVWVERTLLKRQHIKTKKNLQISIMVCIMIAVSTIVFYPDYHLRGYGEVETAFGKVGSMLQERYDAAGKEKAYDADEIAFIKRVKEVVEPSDVVLNIPQDGSLFTFAHDDLNVYNRTFSLFGGDDSEILRSSLNEYAENEAVEDAVKRTNARYVLQLDAGKYKNNEDFTYWYDYDNWKGIASVSPDTEGFELILEDGDMRLYRIEEQ